MKTRISLRRMRLTTAILALSMLQLAVAGDGPEAENPEAATPGQAYLAFVEALSTGDFNEVQPHLSSFKISELVSETDDAALASLKVLDPLNNLEVVDETLDGDRATVTARGEAMGMAATGTIQMILEDGSWKLLGQLWELGGDSGSREAVEAPVSLHDAARGGDTAAVEAGIDAGADVNARDDGGRTPLCWAANYGHTAAMEHLIEAGADVDAATGRGETPLMIAAGAGAPDALVLLINAGADVNAAGDGGSTALLQAAGMSDWILGQMANGEADTVRMVKALTEAGAEVDATDQWQHRTALMAAALAGRTEVVRALLAAGADVNREIGDGDGTTAVMEAAKAGHADTFKVLVDAGADLGGTDRTGRTILVWAADYPDVVEILKEHGVEGADAVTSSLDEMRCAVDDPQPARDRLTAKGYGEISGDQFLNAAAREDTEAVRLFLEAGIPVNTKDSRDYASTALNTAVHGADEPETALLLLRCGADPNAGLIPPLFSAAGNCAFTEVVLALIEAGADVNAKNAGGATALQMTTWSDCEENARVLREAGAVEE